MAKENKKIEKKSVNKTVQKVASPLEKILENNPPVIQRTIKAILEKAFAETFPEEKLYQNAVKIEHPKVNNYGDYSTNLAMILAGQLKMKPMDAAEKLSRKIEEYIKEHQLISINVGNADKKNIIFRVDDILENVSF